MDPGASNISLDLMRSDSDDDGQSSDERETDDDRIVHNSKNKETEPTWSCSHIIHTDSQCKADSNYTVTCTVSMVLAVPRGYEDDPVIAAEDERHLRKVQSKYIVEAPKAQAYFHIEYNLLPDDKPIKVDLVMFGSVAKVYMDNETKVLKVWQEGDHFWLGWSQSVKLNVTRELLIKMSSHKVTFRLWDTKDRVSPKAKYDRPKAFRLPQGRRVDDADLRGGSLDCEPESAGGIKGMVFKLQTLYEKKHPITTSFQNCQKDAKPTDYKRLSKFQYDSKLPTMEASGVSEKRLSSVIVNTDGSLAQEATFSKQSFGGKQNPETIDPNRIKSIMTEDQEKDTASSKLTRSLGHCTKGPKDTTTISSTKSGTLKDSSLLLSKKKPTEERWINGVATAELMAMYFLAGETSLTDCLTIHCGRVFKGLCSITLDQPLMSEELKAELNPLIITILSASSLPSTPVPFYELKQKCSPVYCQYKFLNMPAHRTKGQSHGSKIRFKDVNMILTGLLSTDELLEFLRGPPLEIEVHDRDRKTGEPFSNPASFNTEAAVGKLDFAALLATKQTTYSPFREMRKLRDPYGIAKLNLSDLLKGYRYLKLNLPIRGSDALHWMGTDKNEWGGNEPETAGALDAQGNALPNGHYLEANSKLKVQVELAQPLNLDPERSEVHCPFGRIVYIFKYNNTAFLKKLSSEIFRINALAFKVPCCNMEMAQINLQGRIMDAKDRENKYLDALTGFHFLDKTLHLFVLEGLKDEAIRKLWETVPLKLDEDVEQHVVVLYNSGLSFSKRLYDTLDVGLSPVHLDKPLETIMRQPLVYIRDRVPYTCLQAMLRVNHLCRMNQLEEVVQNNLFPSAEMVHSLRNEFGLTPSTGVEELIPGSTEAKVILPPPVSKRRIHTPIDNINKDYLSWKRNQANQEHYTKNFIQANIEDIQKGAHVLQTPNSSVFVAKVDDYQSVHNYSIQTMNSSSLAKELLHKEMAKYPARRFTFSQDYHSFTVDPVDIQAERKALEAGSRAAWCTHTGFICHDLRSSLESNQHPRHPDEARVEELRKPWKENVLHGNTLEPVLNRATWPWSKRHEDFELYRKPPAVLSPVPPVTIHLAGEALHQEQLQAAHAQYVRWWRKILPDKDPARRGRVPEFKCHMRKAGLDKLHDILKDKPMKLSLKAWRGSLPMPYTDTEKEEKLEHIHLSDTQTNARQAGQHSKCQFGRYWRSHSFQHKRTALPLTDEEKSIHVFQQPQNTTKLYADLAQSKRNVIEMRTYNSVCVHMK